MRTVTHLTLDYNNDKDYKERYPYVLIMEDKHVKLIRYQSIDDIRELRDTCNKLLKGDIK
jgi:hypothetical protein